MIHKNEIVSFLSFRDLRQFLYLIRVISVEKN